MGQNNAHTIPERKDVAVDNTWNLEKLFSDDTAWDVGLDQISALTKKIDSFKGTLGQSAARLKECFDFMNEVELFDEQYSHVFEKFQNIIVAEIFSN